MSCFSFISPRSLISPSYLLIASFPRDTTLFLFIWLSPRSNDFSKAATSGCTHFLKFWVPPNFLEVIVFVLHLIALFFPVLFQSLKAYHLCSCIPISSGRKAAGLCWNFFTLFICILKDVVFYVTVILKVWVLYDFIWFHCWLYVFWVDVWEIQNLVISTDL